MKKNEKSLFGNAVYCHSIHLNVNKGLPLLSSPKYFILVSDAITLLCRKQRIKTLGYCLLSRQVNFILFSKQRIKLNAFIEAFKKQTRENFIPMLKEDGETDLVEAFRFTSQTRKYKVWDTSFEEKRIHDLASLQSELDYLHDLPCVGRLVEHPEDYPYSSAAFYIKNQKTSMEVAHLQDVKF